jgi:hypothetical protein
MSSRPHDPRQRLARIVEALSLFLVKGKICRPCEKTLSTAVVVATLEVSYVYIERVDEHTGDAKII